MASGPNWIICWLWKFNFRTLSSSNNAREYCLLTLEIETLWSFGHKSPWFQVRVEYGKLMIASYMWSDWSNFGSGAGQMASCICFPQRKKSINKYEVKIPESTNQKSPAEKKNWWGVCQLHLQDSGNHSSFSICLGNVGLWNQSTSIHYHQFGQSKIFPLCAKASTNTYVT